jgi:hypothetical protein
MVSKGYDRLFFFKQSYVSGYDAVNDTNDAADGIIESADRYLLSQEEIFEAEGGWGTFALTVGLGAAGAACLCAVQPRVGAALLGGNLVAAQWRSLAFCTAVGGCAGNLAGIHFIGNPSAARNHWLAYTYVKSMNRYEGKNVLGKAPFMY